MDFLDFLPLVAETIDTIRTRMDADVNAGLSPTDPAFLDTTPGGFYWDLTQPAALEIERLWDFASTEVVAAMFVTTAWGDYLDEHGAVIDVGRKDEVKASGLLTITGTDGTLIPTGYQTAQPAIDPDADPIIFKTTASGTIAGGTLDLAVEADEAGTAGNVAPGTVTLPIDSIDGVATVTNGAAITGGEDVESDESYRDRLLLEYKGAGTAGNQADYQRWALATPGVGFVTVDPEWNGPGTVRVVITDSLHNPAAEVTVEALQDFLDPPLARTTTVGAQTLPLAAINVVSTTGFPSSGQAYINGQAVNYTGVSPTTLTGASGGSGLVPGGSQVIVGSHLGAGEAPIGADVVVATVVPKAITVVATIAFVTGYTLVDQTAAITTAITDYIDSLNPGDDVILQHVIAAFFRVPGVYDVSGVTLNGSAANVTVAATEVAQTVLPLTLS